MCTPSPTEPSTPPSSPRHLARPRPKLFTVATAPASRPASLQAVGVDKISTVASPLVILIHSPPPRSPSFTPLLLCLVRPCAVVNAPPSIPRPPPPDRLADAPYRSASLGCLDYTSSSSSGMTARSGSPSPLLLGCRRPPSSPSNAAAPKLARAFLGRPVSSSLPPFLSSRRAFRRS